MGTPQLNIKKRLNYRTGYQSRSCGCCDEYTEVQITGIGGANLGKQPRCKRIGLESGRAYAINPKNICDAYDGSKRLARLKGDRWNPPEPCNS